MNDEHEVITKGWFRTEMRTSIRVAIDELASLISKSSKDLESRMAKQEDLLALTERVKVIEERLDGHDKEFKGFHQKFDAMFLELKEIRREIKQADTRADVLDLQIRVSKLEKRAQ